MNPQPKQGSVSGMGEGGKAGRVAQLRAVYLLKYILVVWCIHDERAMEGTSVRSVEWRREVLLLSHIGQNSGFINYEVCVKVIIMTTSTGTCTFDNSG